MRRFHYWRDRLFLAGVLAYVLNRFLVKPHFHTGFFHSYFNDCWLIPCALPPLLWCHRKLGWRTHDGVPQISEIALHLGFWSLFFEVLGPHLVSRTTGDPRDVLAYCAGAIIAAGWWHRDRWGPRRVST